MKNLLIATLTLALLASCSNKDNLLDEVLPEGNTELGSFNLLFPDNNLICTEGKDLTNDEISITFMWSVSENATSYTIEIVNQDTNEVINTSSNSTSKSVALPRDTQSSWSVEANLDDITKESSQWNFYSEGTAQENFAPFPATITDTNLSNDFVEISWKGSDLDNDIASYDLYFGSDPEDLEFIVSKTSDEGSSSQPIIYNTDYTIQVITKDELGNTSISQKVINYQG